MLKTSKKTKTMLFELALKGAKSKRTLFDDGY